MFFTNFPFHTKFTLNVKQHEIDRLQNHLRAQERSLAKSEKYIVEDIALFDQFLDAWNRTASEAAHRYTSNDFSQLESIHSNIFRAEEESRKKEQLVNEIKRLQKVLATYRNDQNHLVDVLKQSRRYQQFLFKFAPQVRY